MSGVCKSGGMERKHDGRGCEAEAEGCRAASEEGSVENLDHLRASTNELNSHPGWQSERLWGQTSRFFVDPVSAFFSYEGIGNDLSMLMPKDVSWYLNISIYLLPITTAIGNFVALCLDVLCV